MLHRRTAWWSAENSHYRRPGAPRHLAGNLYQGRHWHGGSTADDLTKRVLGPLVKFLIFPGLSFVLGYPAPTSNLLLELVISIVRLLRSTRLDFRDRLHP